MCGVWGRVGWYVRSAWRCMTHVCMYIWCVGSGGLIVGTVTLYVHIWRMYGVGSGGLVVRTEAVTLRWENDHRKPPNRAPCTVQCKVLTYFGHIFIFSSSRSCMKMRKCLDLH